ncbi:hypothetical protein ACI00C_000354 [Cronobacter sakazakii]|nr:hypothetical protein [Cronobacter sakazakii]
MPKEVVESHDNFIHILPLIAFVWTVAAFALGHFIGHRAAIKRDRRKEYNSLISPVRLELLKQIESIKENVFYTAQIKKDQILLISDLLRKPQRDKLLSTYKTYAYATSFEGLKSEFGDYGLINIGDTSHALIAASELLKLIPMR